MLLGDGVGVSGGRIRGGVGRHQVAEHDLPRCIDGYAGPPVEAEAELAGGRGRLEGTVSVAIDHLGNGDLRQLEDGPCRDRNVLITLVAEVPAGAVDPGMLRGAAALPGHVGKCQVVVDRRVARPARELHLDRLNPVA